MKTLFFIEPIKFYSTDRVNEIITNLDLVLFHYLKSSIIRAKLTQYRYTSKYTNELAILGFESKDYVPPTLPPVYRIAKLDDLKTVYDNELERQAIVDLNIFGEMDAKTGREASVVLNFAKEDKDELENKRNRFRTAIEDVKSLCFVAYRLPKSATNREKIFWARDMLKKHNLDIYQFVHESANSKDIAEMATLNKDYYEDKCKMVVDMLASPNFVLIGSEIFKVSTDQVDDKVSRILSLALPQRKDYTQMTVTNLVSKQHDVRYAYAVNKFYQAPESTITRLSNIADAVFKDYQLYKQPLIYNFDHSVVQDKRDLIPELEYNVVFDDVLFAGIFDLFKVDDQEVLSILTLHDDQYPQFSEYLNWLALPSGHNYKDKFVVDLYTSDAKHKIYDKTRHIWLDTIMDMINNNLKVSLSLSDGITPDRNLAKYYSFRHGVTSGAAFMLNRDEINLQEGDSPRQKLASLLSKVLTGWFALTPTWSKPCDIQYPKSTIWDGNRDYDNKLFTILEQNEMNDKLTIVFGGGEYTVEFPSLPVGSTIFRDYLTIAKVHSALGNIESHYTAISPTSYGSRERVYICDQLATLGAAIQPDCGPLSGVDGYEYEQRLTTTVHLMIYAIWFLALLLDEKPAALISEFKFLSDIELRDIDKIVR